MALQLFDRVQVAATANTTVSFTLGVAVTGYQDFSVMTNGNTTYYGSSDGTNWEVGIGTYSSTGPTLTRTTILSSSNAGSAVTFTSAPTVWIDYPSIKAVYQDASGNVGIGGTPAVKLDVIGNAPTGGNTIRSYNSDAGSTSASALQAQNGAGTNVQLQTFGTDAILNVSSNNPLSFRTNNTEVMRLTTAGGVSFGSSGTAYGTSGQVLTSAGNLPPTWSTLSSSAVTSFQTSLNGLTPSTATTGAVTLAGTLGVTSGGTGTATAFTTGSVVFAGASGIYTQDNANFFWDDTNNRLGIGTASPTNPLTVSATSGRNAPLATIQSTGATGGGSGFDVGLLVDISAYASSTSALNVKSASTSRFWVGTDGNVGIGTTSPAVKLDIQQNSAANNFPLRVYNSDTGASSGAALTVQQGAVTGLFQAYGNNTVYFGSQTNHPLSIVTNSAERMRISAAGGVYVGSAGTDPGLGNLQVSGAIVSTRVNPRALASTANSATPTLNTDNYDIMVITGQSVAITSFTTNLTGTPVNGQKLWISITGTAAIGITWGASFEASTVPLPTTTVTTARLDVGFVWNVATSKWRCVASA